MQPTNNARMPPARKKQLRGQKPLKLGVRLEEYYLSPVTPDVITNLKSVALAGSFLQQLFGQSPVLHVNDWAAKLADFQHFLPSIPHIGFASETGYRTNWTFRLWAIAHMRQHNVQALCVPADYQMSSFCKLFPDQNAWLLKLASVRQGTTFNQTCLALGYTGPAELFSMYLCLIGDEDCFRVTAPWILQNQETVSKAALEYLQTHGQNAHPALLLQSAWRICQDNMHQSDSETVLYSQKSVSGEL